MPAAAFGQPNLQDLLALLYASQGQSAPVGGLRSTSGKSSEPPLSDLPGGGPRPQSSHPIPGEGTIGGGIPLDGGQFTPQDGPAGRLGVGTTSGGAPGGGNSGGGGLPIPGAGGSGAGAGSGGAFGGAGATGGWGGAAGAAGGAAGAGAAAGAGGLAGLLGNVNWGRLALAAAALLAGSQGGAPTTDGTATTPRRGGGGGGGGGGSKVPLAPPVPYQGIQHQSQFVGYQPIQPFTLGGGPTNFVSGAGSSTPARPPTPPPPAAKPEGKRPPRDKPSNPRPNRPSGPANGPQNRTPNTAPQGVDQAALMQFLASLMQMQRPGGVGGQSQGGG